MTRNIPLSIDEELLAEIDAVAEQSKESRSAIMRRAIREGLGVVKSGGSADVILLDGETSRDVDSACAEAKVSRAKFVIDAIRTGLQATYCRLMRDHWIREQDRNQGNKEAEGFIHAFEHSMLLENPMGQEVRAAMRQRGTALTRFWDLLLHVPEAFERCKLVEQLIQIRRKRGAYPIVWGKGLSTPEIRWQVEMDEKYGDNPLPEKEAKAREEARKREESTRKTHMDAVLPLMSPPYPEE